MQCNLLTSASTGDLQSLSRSRDCCHPENAMADVKAIALRGIALRGISAKSHMLDCHILEWTTMQ